MTIAHPWMANSVPAIKQAMLREIGAPSIEALFEQIPAEHRTAHDFALPPALRSEPELRRHMLSLLRKNTSCEENLSFLGAGIWQHHVPAICDEIAGRSEFLTSVWGTAMSDHGRNQAWFEFASQLGELVACDFVGLPVYSWGCAAGNAVRLASRLNGRRRVLVPEWMDPERLAVIRQYCEPEGMPNRIAVELVAQRAADGLIDLDDLRTKLNDGVTAVYFENPGFLGIIETQGAEIARLAHAAGAEVIVGVDPISLGVLAPPPDYGADIVVGTTQTLGAHMSAGGGAGGFIASRDEERYAREYPTLNISITTTRNPGEHGFALSLSHQSSYGMREQGKDWTGNSVYLTAIANAVYMSLMGPEGFAELGELVLARSHDAARRLDAIPGVSVRWKSGFFREFVVDFSATGRSVAQVNAALLKRGIFGGKDLSADIPALGQCALFAVTEVHAPEDIARLATTLEEILR
ncbi:aminomethyl-transferring glycine dehydrogenase subunit GcvPA [Falsiroseomonas tokyonensis]|uniref:Aminomethyl-transferring glycine dehydrogenase subunit GcvPA n=1 Tax=Falsiroseomonas tokyonensis TaxID=430521 RepID=A0ABV7BV77_9PROT|nr:aminomethyl-transferring glycine dehydrogenase subunit GcvPA [Falsiroseomonas tokyonensis]MBU8538541.1 aminomethyl-transferring glycine dehydrogenase subunit GcvPA [Falsiroseomonas tokyonensis]